MENQSIIEFLSQSILETAKDLHQQIDFSIPLICFEGLPGTGKSTQSLAVASRLEQKGFKTYVIDLPSEQHALGSKIHSLHQQKPFFNQLEKQFPEIHLRLIMVNFLLNLLEASQKKVDFILMARGSLSTAFLHARHYEARYQDKLSVIDDLLYFKNADLVIFLETKISIAVQRVTARDRGPLRNMDRPEQMARDYLLFKEFAKALKIKRLEKINSEGEISTVTNSIVTLILSIFRNHS